MRQCPRRGLILFLLLLASVDCFAQGFGSLSKMTVTLRRKLPAVFPLTGTAVNVKVIATAPNTATLAQSLGPLVETMLQQNDQRITIENSRPQTVISCNITGYVVPKVQKLTRNNTVITKTGTQAQQQPYLKVTGDLIVSYKAKDVKTGKTLDAAVLESKINQDYETTGSKTKSLGEDLESIKKIPGALHKKHEAEEAIPASAEDVNQLLLRNIAEKLATRVVTTDEPIQVYLAKGKLEHAGKLGQSGLWPRMLEEVSSMPPFPKKEDEAYRLYDIGVAYEAIGYDTADPTEAMTAFDRASINYGKAIDDAPDEKYFREPQKRIEQALVIMKTLSERAKKGGAPVFEDADAAKTSEGSAAASQVHASAAAAGDPDTLTNDSIIDLAKSGMNDQNLISNIQDAKKVSFDLSINGQKQLMQAGVSNAVLAAMRQKARSSGASHRTSKTGTATGSKATAPSNHS